MAGWLSIIFFGGCALVAIAQIIDSRPRLIIDDEGILDRTLRVGRIPWSEIQGAYIRTISGNDFICLEVRCPEQYIGEAKGIKQALA
ncbi:MAG: PH domain-containing protein [Verrucomicrobiae bacterium]|nr:PH domain-containing protein [Verrucomicrobiae bacterium]